ncbi:MAG: hypothetical protein U0694_13990 [Anaerolineae bacterium]
MYLSADRHAHDRRSTYECLGNLRVALQHEAAIGMGTLVSGESMSGAQAFQSGSSVAARNPTPIWVFVLFSVSHALSPRLSRMFRRNPYRLQVDVHDVLHVRRVAARHRHRDGSPSARHMSSTRRSRCASPSLVSDR